MKWLIVKLEATTFETSYIENIGNGKFKIRSLPVICQIAPATSLLTCDVNQDGNRDVLMVGNSYSTNAIVGRYDALTGVYLEGDGKGNFTILRGYESGFKADKDARSLTILSLFPDKKIFVVGNNSDSLQFFQLVTNDR